MIEYKDSHSLKLTATFNGIQVMCVYMIWIRNNSERFFPIVDLTREKKLLHSHCRIQKRFLCIWEAIYNWLFSFGWFLLLLLLRLSLVCKTRKTFIWSFYSKQFISRHAVCLSTTLKTSLSLARSPFVCPSIWYVLSCIIRLWHAVCIQFDASSPSYK